MTTPYQTLILSDLPVSYVPANELSLPYKDIVQNVYSSSSGFASPGASGAPAPTALGGAAWYASTTGEGGAVQNPFSSPTSAVSAECWFAGTAVLGGSSAFASSSGGVFSDIPGFSQLDWGLGFFGDMQPTWAIGIGGDRSIDAPGSYNDGAYHHVVATWDGATGAMVLYVDAVAVGTLAGVAGAITGAAAWWFGANAISYNGRINNMAVYGSVLSPAQVLAHYNAGRITPMPPSGPYQTLVVSYGPLSYVPANELAYPLLDIIQGVYNDPAYEIGTPGVSGFPAQLGTYAWRNAGFSTIEFLAFKNPLHTAPSGTVSCFLWMQGTFVLAGTFPWNSSQPGVWTNDGTDGCFGLAFQGNGQPCFGVNAGSGFNPTLVSATPCNDGKLHFIVATYDNATGTADIYIDGFLDCTTVLLGPGALPITTALQGAPEYIAFGDNSNYMPGLANNIAIYPVVLDAGQILALYEAAGVFYTTVPYIVGSTVGTATVALTASTLVLGGTLQVFSPTVAAGLIISQSPAAGALVPYETPVSVIISKGPQASVVPDVLGMTAADANAAIIAAGFIPKSGDPVVTEAYTIGDVANQNPLGGIVAPGGSIVTYNIAVFLLPFDVDTTVISQYSNSSTLLRLVENMAQYIDPRANLEQFYNYVFNVDTATGFGLDYWGKIVGVSRLLRIVTSGIEYFGFDNTATPPADWQNFGGAPFSRGALDTQAYLLPDSSYRTLILTKALSNIVATTAPALNKLLQMLFPGRGKVYVSDDGAMSMTFVFEFSLTPVEYAILTQSGALPHPAGVFVNVTVPP